MVILLRTPSHRPRAREVRGHHGPFHSTPPSQRLVYKLDRFVAGRNHFGLGASAKYGSVEPMPRQIPVASSLKVVFVRLDDISLEGGRV